LQCHQGFLLGVVTDLSAARGGGGGLLTAAGLDKLKS